MNKNYTKIAKVALVLVCTISLVLVGYFISKRVTYAQVDQTDRSLGLVNQIREEKGLAQLRWNPKLAESAEDKLNDILENKYFQHTSPDGVKAWDFILENNYSYIYAGENLAIDYDNVDDAFKAWVDSPSHLANIVSEKYREYGFAQGEGDVEGHSSNVYVQIFATQY